ncbi:MAG: hypothetical protein FD123_1222 [Bacteroidetes bacterium]|nr:MAG: hypothetical protein FD123_1222 [Bacteroidota bacterium]
MSYSIKSEPWIVAEPEQPVYGKQEYPLQKETYEIIGICMEVHKELGYGFQEVVYKDALEQEFKWRNIPFEREKKYEINYKGIILPHYYFADFVVRDNIILEVKAQQGVIEDHYCQVINYLAASKCPVGLLVNFGEQSLRYKRLILSK